MSGHRRGPCWKHNLIDHPTANERRPRMSMEARLTELTALPVDAIINAATTDLRPGNGVSGAIHEAAGPELLEACQRIGHCPVGSAVITSAYSLPARFVVHAVGPT